MTDQKFELVNADGTKIDPEDGEASAKRELKERVFMGPGYVMPLDKGTFGLYRDIYVKAHDPRTGKEVKERLGKPVGPIKVVRPRGKDDPAEAVVLRTYDPGTDKVIELVEVQ